MAAVLWGVAGVLLGAVLGVTLARAAAKKRPVVVVVDDGSRTRELQAASARRLAEGRADKLQVQVDRLRAACLLPANDSATATMTLHADAAARFVRLFNGASGGVSGAVVAGANGLSSSAKETTLERSLAATVSALSPVSAAHLDTIGQVVVVVVLRSGLGVRARVLGSGQMRSPLLRRAAVAELNIAALARLVAAPAASFELGAASRVKEIAVRAGFSSLALLSGDSIEVAVSAMGLSLDSLRAVRRPLQVATLQGGVGVCERGGAAGDRW